MLYYLFDYLEQLDVPGAGLFQYISFRSAMAVIFALALSAIFGKRVIKLLQRRQIGETIRDLGLEGQYQKQGTPTMGGLIIIGAMLIPVLLFARPDNVYILLMLMTTIWLGLIGFTDDYIKVFKKNKKGLRGRFKIIGQVGLGLIVAMVFYFSDDVVVRKLYTENENGKCVEIHHSTGQAGIDYTTQDVKSTLTTIPFSKNNELDYKNFIWFLGEKSAKWVWIIFFIAVIFIVTAVSNGANVTDGLDGLATGVSAIIGVTLGILAYLSGNVKFADYLNIMYIPNVAELVIFAAAFIGALVGFLWYNSFPAQVFMGDTGSLTIGGIIAVFAIAIRKELLLPILCGVFFIESLSVVIQVSWFKYTKKKYGEGRRVFRMSPIHHHFQKKNITEPKIVTRFWIVGIILAVLTVVTLKLQ